MTLIDDRDAGAYDKPVISVMKVKIDPKDAPGLLAETLDAFAGEEVKNLPGFLTAQLLLSVDNETIVVMSEWSDRHAWGKSRYDPIVGTFVKDCYDKAIAIEFEIYNSSRRSCPIRHSSPTTLRFGV
jgi:quinol monooxygenase YgiN